MAAITFIRFSRSETTSSSAASPRKGSCRRRAPRRSSPRRYAAGKRKIKIIESVKKVIHQDKLILAIIGIIALAVTVNLIELACSAGLPLLYTNILAFNNLSGFAYTGYVLVYVFFFLLDDLIIFTIAMVSMRVTGISNRYTKYSSLIGGLIMALIGFLLIFFPDLIMF